MVFEYDVPRQGWRIQCGDRCVLHHDGIRTECVLVDISVSGVLVNCDHEVAETLQPGAECGLFLCSDPHLCAAEVPCVVTRRDADRIGLQFPPVISKA